MRQLCAQCRMQDVNSQCALREKSVSGARGSQASSRCSTSMYIRPLSTPQNLNPRPYNLPNSKNTYTTLNLKNRCNLINPTNPKS